MRIVRFEAADHSPRWGLQTVRGIVDPVAANGQLPCSVQQVIANWKNVSQQIALLPLDSLPVVDTQHLLTPLDTVGKIICIGLNYRDHAIESGMAIPTEPVVFSKLENTLAGPDQEIEIPKNSKQVDFEAELVVVIGKSVRNVSAADAMDCVFGYTVGHDVSARDWQIGRPGSQWLLGKTFDHFAPIGPAIVTQDEISDPHNLNISLAINGESMQSSNTRQLIFSIPEVIAHLSLVMTLKPGDIIFTGTPPGVGMARKPPRFLQSGDICDVTIEHLGTLRNRFV